MMLKHPFLVSSHTFFLSGDNILLVSALFHTYLYSGGGEFTERRVLVVVRIRPGAIAIEQLQVPCTAYTHCLTITFH